MCRALSVLPAPSWHGLSPARHPSGCPSGILSALTTSMSREEHGADPVCALRSREDWLGCQGPGNCPARLNLAGLVTL